MSTNAKRFNIYVIELDKEILKVKKFREANPNYDPAKPCVYVGMTARSPEERFQQHLSGYKAARYEPLRHPFTTPPVPTLQPLDL